jgi:hypothetical protein
LLKTEACRGQYFYPSLESRQAGAFQQGAGLAKAHAVLFYMEKTGMIYAIDRAYYRIGTEKQRGKAVSRVMPVAPMDQKMSA